MHLLSWPKRRPSRTATVAFAVTLAGITAGAIGFALATGGAGESAPTPPADWTPASASPSVPGLEPIDPATVPPEGLVIGRLRVLPAGSVPTGAGRGERGNQFKLRPDETMRGAYPGERFEHERTALQAPDGAGWTVERPGGGWVATDSAGAQRLVEEGIIVHHQASEHPWLIATGALMEGFFLEKMLNERGTANFTFTRDGVVAVVVDSSPSASTDRVWQVALVVKDQWVSFAAPVVPFETVARFLDALVEANQ